MTNRVLRVLGQGSKWEVRHRVLVMGLEFRMPHLSFFRVDKFEFSRGQEISMDFDRKLHKFLFQLLVPLLFRLEPEVLGSSREPDREGRIGILVLLPLYLEELWAEIEHLSEHTQSKPFALGDGNALLHFFQWNPILVSGTLIIECRVNKLEHFQKGAVLGGEQQLMGNLD